MSGRHVTFMTIEDAEHYTPEQRAAIVAQYPTYEREARSKGIPTFARGRVFPIEESRIACDPIEIPKHWPQIGGMDFGWTHPFAAVKLAWDRDVDCLYVAQAYRVKEQPVVIHAASLKAWGDWLPWSWPRDGRNETLAGAGVALAKQYEAQGLRMLHEHAQFEPTHWEKGNNVSVEAGLSDMLTRMETGRLKVFRTLNEWFEEFRLYHRDEKGLVVKERDDLMSATRYGMMMLRFAATKPAPIPPRPKQNWIV